MSRSVALMALLASCSERALILAGDNPGDSFTADDSVDSPDAYSGSNRDLDAATRDLTAPDRKRVFVTSMVFTGDLGGVAGADSKCQRLAMSSGLAGVFNAWLSDGVSSPAVRFTHSRDPYVLLSGSIVATDWDDLVKGALRHAINVTEKGMQALPTPATVSSTGYEVWTNTDAHGSVIDSRQTCANWSNEGAGSSHCGVWNSQGEWTAPTSRLCAIKAALYCFEQ